MSEAGTTVSDLITAQVGSSLKAQHYQTVLQSRPPVAFFEVHAENYMVSGGPHIAYLEEIAENWPLSIHGVGMSLGSAEGLNARHLERFVGLVNRFQPFLVSEHLAWSVQGGHYLNDLLPLPLTDETLAVVSDNVKRLMDALGRQILMENPSSYLVFEESHIPEAEFLMMLAANSGCGLLLDVNNIFVSGRNSGFDIEAYLRSIDPSVVGEIHLAGHTVRDVDGVEIRIDDHGSAVSDDVWHLFAAFIRRAGFRPTLVEWDSNVPPFDLLLAEAEKAALVAVDACSGRKPCGDLLTSCAITHG